MDSDVPGKLVVPGVNVVEKADGIVPLERLALVLQPNLVDQLFFHVLDAGRRSGRPASMKDHNNNHNNNNNNDNNNDNNDNNIP